MVVGGRRVPDYIVRDLAIIDHVGALLHFHRRDRGHRFDAIHVHFAELLDERQHRVQLALEMRNLALSDRNPREMGDTANGGGIDGHYIWPLRAISAPPLADAAFAP